MSLVSFISSSYSVANILVLIIFTLLCIVDFNAYHLILLDFPQNGQIKEALESLLALEKQTRLVSAEVHAVYIAYGCTVHTHTHAKVGFLSNHLLDTL